MLARVWESFRRWTWAERLLLLLVAPWLVLLAWMVTTAKPRKATAGAVSAVALVWLLLVAGALGTDDVGGDDVATGRSGTEREQTTTAETSTTTATGRRETTTPTEASLTTTTEASPTTTVTVAPARLMVVHITDGDTLDVSDGRTVRLAQVDAPETDECYGSESTAALAALADGAAVDLRRPAGAPQTDRYGRTLADVVVDGRSVNEALIRQGAAEFDEDFASEDVDLAGRLRAAEDEARSAGRGVWSVCAAPPTTFALSPPSTSGGSCEPAYPDVCIPPPPPDLDCGDIPHRRFRVVAHPDPHGFDGDDDGIGCESG